MFLSEYLVDLKSWSALQDLEHARNGRGQRAKWVWHKNSRALCAHSISKNPPLINPGSTPGDAIIMNYRIADNFRGGLIFVIFVTALTVTKFIPHENLPQ